MSLLSRLKTEGVLLLYHDYRNGSYQDLSGNSKHGTPTVCKLQKGHVKFPNTYGAVISAGADTLGAGAGTLVAYCLPRSPGQSAFGRIFENGNLIVYLSGTSSEMVNYSMGTIISTPSNSMTWDHDHVVVLSWDSDGVANCYIDGTLVQGPDDMGTPAAGTSMYIGNRGVLTRGFDGEFYSFGLINRELTPTEVTQLTAELRTSKPDARGVIQGIPTMLPIDDNVVAAYNFPNTEDLTGNGYNATLGSRNISKVKDRNGAHADTDGNGDQYYSVPLAAWPGTTGAIEIIGMLRSANGGGRFMGTDHSSGVNYEHRAFTNGTFLSFSFKNDAGAFSVAPAENPTLLNVTRHYVIQWEYDGSTNTTATLFIDGDEIASATDGGFPATPNLAFYFGAWLTTQGLDGKMHQALIHNTTRTEAEWLARAKRFNSGAYSLLGSGARATTSNLSAGQQVPGTPFYVDSGAWSVGVETVNGKPSKVLTCETAGIVYAEWSQLRNNLTEGAYGTWEFWTNKVDSSKIEIVFVASVIGGYSASDQDGYFYQLNAAEQVRLYRVNSGTLDLLLAQAPDSTVAHSVWGLNKITRSPAGVFSLYYNGTLWTVAAGDNPSTENTYTTGKYITIDMDAGDKIALSTLQGEPLFKKYYGVV
jgi:hypothetical protein